MSNRRDFAKDLTIELLYRAAKLIKKGMFYSPVYGELAFTVPLFDAFMHRAIPKFKQFV